MIGVYDIWQLFGGECCYCGCQTWVEGIEGRAAAKRRLGVVTTKELRRRRATREHVHRKEDGGNNSLANLLLACNLCNTLRGTKPMLQHLSDRRR